MLVLSTKRREYETTVILPSSCRSNSPEHCMTTEKALAKKLQLISDEHCNVKFVCDCLKVCYVQIIKKCTGILIEHYYL